MSDEVGFDTIPDGELSKWDVVGKTIVGVLKSYTVRPNTGKGVGHQYEVKTKNGVEAFFAPSLLQKKLSDVKIGSLVQIKYTLESKTANGNTLKHFEVGAVKAGDPRFDALAAKFGVEALDTVGGNEFDQVTQ